MTQGVRLGKEVTLAPASHIAQDTPGLFGGWIIHKEGFRAPKILEIARLQADRANPQRSHDPMLGQNRATDS